MSLVITCESCGQKLKAHEKLLGKSVKCPKCAAPIQVPTPSVASGIGDLLDDELQTAPTAEDAAPARAGGPKCKRCGDDLPAGTHYCVSCGYNNVDVDGAIGQVALDYGKRQQKLEKMARPRHWLWSAVFFWMR